jgi:hypothetical protein
MRKARDDDAPDACHGASCRTQETGAMGKVSPRFAERLGSWSVGSAPILLQNIERDWFLRYAVSGAPGGCIRPAR